MKLAIISDSHDNEPNLKKALKFIKINKISVIIHCGDISAPSILSEIIIPNFSGKIYLVCGNVGDCKLLKEICAKYKNVKYFDEFGEIVIDNIKIAFCHKPELANKLANSKKFGYVFYGHTHKPWEEKIKNQKSKIKNIELVNPGTLAGLFYKATFAILDTKNKKLELKILEKI